MFSIRISPLTPEMLAYAEHGAPKRQALISIMDHQWDVPERYPASRVLRLCFDDAVDSSFYQNLITMEQALERMRGFLGYVGDWADLASFLPEGWDVSPMARRSAMAAHFAAVLEMTKRGQLVLRQGETFAPIEIRRKDP